ncbi:alpha/beta fold hydrolase [Agrobacterium sp. a22-2]|uniref:alpha/beta fold hydrolase n=1 Tax=Agrobacterium sp. a22-2 TaxID=2283840 RepID=UPI0014466085|nr:alpha/beta fold hydrolase [Agrobacterium sp. a22-2]NKN37765.1 alpha/beta fold hydrolase [Agrobacterium sp. a22-2]
MTTFVLVHAAFHGDWIWSRVSDRLRQMGHRAIAPSFAAEHAGNGATLSSHVAELLDLLSHFTPTQVVLVAQSYGGIVATAAAARVPAQIAALVYIDAILPEHGKSMLETIPMAFTDAYRARRAAHGGLPVILPAPGPMSDLRNAGDRSLVAGRISPQPLASFDQPADLVTRSDVLAAIPRHYIHCSAHSIAPSASLYTDFARRAATRRGWFRRDLPVGFYGVLSSPGSVAEAIVEAVHGVSGGLSGRCLQRVLEAVEDGAGHQISVAQLARIAGLSPWHFTRCFKQSMGVPPHAYLVTRRMETAARLLRQGDLALRDIARQSGFGSASRFATAFRQATGMAPHIFRKLQMR